MRRVLFQMMVSVDGYFEGPNRELDWHNVDAEFNEYAIAMLDSVDTLLFGRVTYQLMASYWPTPAAIKDDPIVASKMNSLHKVVFSRTLAKAEWGNTTLVKNDVAAEVLKLKRQPGKDLIILGSSDLALTFIEQRLIDEFRIMVNPVVLGSGKPLFKGINERLKLRLTKLSTFKSGNVLLYYEPST
jgi:dihydrofolate reductase